MDNWVKLLLLVKFSLLTRYYNKKKFKIQKVLIGRYWARQFNLKKFKKDPQLKEKNKIYLLIKNFRNKRPLKKLNYIKVGLFLVNK